MNEEFKPIQGFENYAVSNKGNVRNINSLRNIVPNLGINGYYYVGLITDLKVVNKTIHRLVALEWIDNPEEKECVDHINRDRLDNNVENLRWCTRQENMMNKSKRKNKSGYSGVSYNNYRQQWVAQLMKNGKIYSSPFNTIEEAIKHRAKLEKEHFGIFAPTINIEKLSIHLDDITNYAEVEKELEELLQSETSSM